MVTLENTLQAHLNPSLKFISLWAKKQDSQGTKKRYTNEVICFKRNIVRQPSKMTWTGTGDADVTENPEGPGLLLPTPFSPAGPPLGPGPWDLFPTVSVP